MPGGRCAASNQPFGGYSRAALVEINVRGIKKTLQLGGVAEAYFPERSDEDLQGLKPAEVFGLVWRDAAFFTHDFLLGPVHVQMLRGATVQPATGLIRSLATGSEDREMTDFFPALNRNEFNFEFLIPRLKLSYQSVGPIVNSAIIKQIPPYGVTYRLEKMAELAALSDGNFLLRALAGQAIIQTCNVKLHIAGGIELDIVEVKENYPMVQFRLKALNVTEAPSIRVTWMIWPRPDSSFIHPMGAAELPRNRAISLIVNAQRDMFFEPKWLVLSGAVPFEVDASAAVQIPTLA